MTRARGHLLPCAAVVLLVSSAVAQVATNSSTASSATSTSGLSSGSTSDTTASNLTTVEQRVPAFTGIRSCLPFNILVAAPDTLDESSNSTDGRILITADYSVVNSTSAAVEDGILTLSLAGGFESSQPINFTVVVPAGSDLHSVANAGSGLVALGPGHNVTSLRLVSPTVGQIEAVNLTAGSVSVQSSGVLGGTLSGAIKQADISSTGTGSIAFTSTTPVQLKVQLSGITTVVATIPQGSSITGTAGGLSKVQYTDGLCSVTSDTPLLFPVPSIFGGSSFGFGSASNTVNQKCQQVAAAQMRPAAQAAENPQWTCGIVVDGQMSCQVSSNAIAVPWNITAAPTPTEEPGAVPSPITNAANNTGSTPQTMAPNAASPTVESIGVDSGGASNSTTSANTASAAVEPPAGAGGAGATGAGRRLFQLVATPTDSGLITTGSGTSGPGSFASGTGSVSGPGGATTQQTSSEGGSQPQTTLSTGGVGSNIYNPVYVPGTSIQDIAAQANLTVNETSPPTNANPTANNTAPSAVTTSTTSPTTSTSISTSGGGTPAARASTSGPGTSSGIAVASTTCASKAQSLSMLVQPLKGATAGSTAGSGARNSATATSGATGAAGAGPVDAGPSATAVSSATSSAGTSPLP